MRLPLCITSMTWLSSEEAAAPLPSQAKSSQLITSSTLHHEAIGKCIRPMWHSINSTYHGKRHDLTYSSKLWMSGPQLKRQNLHRMSVGSFLLCTQMNVYQLRMLTTQSKMTAIGGVVLLHMLRVTSSFKQYTKIFYLPLLFVFELQPYYHSCVQNEGSVKVWTWYYKQVNNSIQVCDNINIM